MNERALDDICLDNELYKYSLFWLAVYRVHIVNDSRIPYLTFFCVKQNLY